ncbi:MAG: UDP-N-acetylmuramate dehydrogenase [Bacteroidetes bacterium]|nr:UDP-N-acetylmuramate dehydrogenase [Bacteroidota bacterium]
MYPNLHLMLQRHIPLKSLNTFGFDVEASLFLPIADEEILHNVWKTNLLSMSSPLILGGGSNILFKDNYPGLILQNLIAGMQVAKETENHIWLRCGGGEVWHNVVMYTIQNNWGGLENMSLIPGTIGASPIQNIGAYGAELKDVFEELEAFDMLYGKMVTLRADDCAFAYRDSLFKQNGKGRYFITYVTLRLNKNPSVNVKYGDIANILEQWGISKPGIADVSRAVIHIRRSKLPDPAELGNCGSFFKNPVVSKEVADTLCATYPDAKRFDQPDGTAKLAAGWLIEKAGWKGYRRGDAGVHEKQALVMVNYGNATGAEILSLAGEIVEDIQAKFQVNLEMEVNTR